MKRVNLSLSILGILLLLQVAACQDSKKEKAQTSPPAAAQAVAVRDTIWIDVRTPQEFDAGHLSEATNIPLQVLDQEFQSRVPDKNAVIVLYCRSGHRAGMALERLQSWGYTHASNAGGFEALKASRGK
ncbi:MAG TPA: rhodanese-like domain-containing protein [Fibrobacteraceae bacterium]|nr:rhodanese-like domain-containing protein [Fibrobacteraceae bacterium]